MEAKVHLGNSQQFVYTIIGRTKRDLYKELKRLIQGILKDSFVYFRLFDKNPNGYPKGSQIYRKIYKKDHPYRKHFKCKPENFLVIWKD